MVGGPESEPESELLVKCNACEVCLCAANSAHNRNGTHSRTGMCRWVTVPLDAPCAA